MKNKRLFLGVMVLCAVIVSGGVHAEPAFLGMQVQGMAPEIIEALGKHNVKGVLVRDVAVGTPANKAGFLRGDLIVKLGGKDIDTFAQIVAVVRSLKAGQKVDAVVVRDGKKLEFVLKTTARPKAWSVSKQSFAILPQFGVTFAAITPDIRKQFGLRWGSVGVVVSKIDEKKIATVERLIDLKPGDVIVRVNQVDIWHPDQLMRAYLKARDAGRASLFLMVEGSTQGVRNGFRFSLLPVE
ncbi:MAG: PDZ domain-containing protein [Rhodospirillales bacterium]|jgi:serine protease Do|nr:PDZ domain-containing protein [Rhodospirillales bacterium]